MKKIILSVAAVAMLSTQVFGANTAFLAKVVAKMTEDIISLQAKSVYQEEAISKLSSENTALKEKMIMVNQSMLAVDKDVSKINVVAKAQTESNEEALSSIQKELRELKDKNSSVDKELEKNEKSLTSINNSVTNFSTKDMRVDGINKKIAGIEAALNGLEPDEEQIDPEVERRILKYIESK